MDLTPGTLVADRIRLQEPLGQGGMGSLWAAEHLALKARVAVKFLSPEHLDEPDVRTRFAREARAAALIRSPHAVQVFDYGVWDDLPYIVMELLEGEDLAQRMKRVGPLPPDEVIEVVEQVAKALTRAHAEGVIHRDIKPGNIFLVDSDDDELYVKVLDFGIAKRVFDVSRDVTGTGTLLGTPYYMSPEQVISSKGVDHRSDLWSLGVVTYHALTGKLPFSGESIGALCVSIETAVFERATKHRPELPATLDDWFRRALARSPSSRFASARELAAALKIALPDRELQQPDTVAIAADPAFDPLALGAITEAIGPTENPAEYGPSTQAERSEEGATGSITTRFTPAPTVATASPPTPQRASVARHSPRRHPRAMLVAAAGLFAFTLVVLVFAGVAFRARQAQQEPAVELVPNEPLEPASSEPTPAPERSSLSAPASSPKVERSAAVPSPTKHEPHAEPRAPSLSAKKKGNDTASAQSPPTTPTAGGVEQYGF